MRIAICDDDALCREQILAIVTEYISKCDRELTVSVYEKAAALLDDALRYGGWDIYILDIIMPGINGIRLGMELRRHDPDCKILYLSSSREFALDSYQAKASDYLVKPVQKERLFQSLDDTISTIANRKEKSLIVKTRDSSTKLPYDSILYAELKDRKVSYCTAGGNRIEGSSIRTTFADAIKELLQDSRFVLCGPGLAVNLYYVTTVSNDHLTFKTGARLHIGKRAGREFRDIWADFWMNQEGCK